MVTQNIESHSYINFLDPTSLHTFNMDTTTEEMAQDLEAAALLDEETPVTEAAAAPEPTGETEEAEEPHDNALDIGLEDSLDPEPAAAQEEEEDPKESDEPAAETAPVQNFVKIANLTRPFSLPGLKRKIEEVSESKIDTFWINSIKSICFVTLTEIENLDKIIAALHDQNWPDSNPKKLNVILATQAQKEDAVYRDENNILEENNNNKKGKKEKKIKKEKEPVKDARENIRADDILYKEVKEEANKSPSPERNTVPKTDAELRQAHSFRRSKDVLADRLEPEKIDPRLG